MTVTTTNCPSCGAPIAFKLGSSIVVVCEFCSSAVARTDRDVRNLGKVADLVDTRSPLAVGKEGRYDGKPFVLTGRAQFAHPAGGVWDEWYATFGDGRTGWLAEAQGEFYMTFPVAVANASAIPRMSTLRPGASGPLPGDPRPFVVAEVGSGRTVSAEGEIPYELEPGKDFFFADLAAPSGGFATIDYGDDPPAVYVGREVTLRDLGIVGEADEFSSPKRQVGAVRLTCPHCGGPMELRAPESERTTCPSCNALLDVEQGNLRYLKTIAVRSKPAVPLGSVGTFPEGTLTLIGFMTRHCKVESITYKWDEYLLYNPQIGFRWLVDDSHHWSYVVPISAGDIYDADKTASFRGKTFRQFQAVNAFVDTVYGEFYWRVEEGESTRAKDFVKPPEILSREVSGHEVNWSHGVYMSAAEVSAAFKSRELPRPIAVGMAQPNPYTRLTLPWIALLAVAVVAGLLIQMSGSRSRVAAETFRFDPVASADSTGTGFTQQDFDLGGHQNIQVMLSAPVDNSWAYVEGDLVNVETGLVQTFSMPIEYYHGVDGGESWSEGSQTSEVFLSALPAGRYSLRVEAQWEKWQAPMTISATIQQGVPRIMHWVVLLCVVGAGLVVQMLRSFAFEKRRWSESMFNPYESSD